MPVFNLLHPQDFDRVFISMTQSARSITPWHQEYRILPPGGGLRWLRSCLLPHRAGEGLLTGYGVLVDITAEKRRREELLELCAAGGVGVYRAAEDGRLLAVNERFAQICGYGSPSEMLRAQPTTLDLYLTHPDERSVMMRLVKAHGSVQRYALEARTKDGGSVWLSLNLRVVPQAPGEPMQYDAFCADITEQMLRDIDQGHAREFDRTRFGPGSSPGSSLGSSETEKPAGVSTGGLCPVLAHVRDAILWRVRLSRLA